MALTFLKLFAANWKIFLGATLGAILTATVMSWLHVKQIARLEAQHQAELKTLSDQLVKECDNDKNITTNASQQYQAQLSDTRSQLDRLKLVRPATCVSVTVPASKPATGYHAATISENVSRPDERSTGIDSDWLLEFSAEADDDRSKLIGCQKFIRDTWKAKQ